MELYTIVWQPQDGEAEWTEVVAKNLTFEQAKRVAKRYMLDVHEEEDAEFTELWYTSVRIVQGLSGKEYRVRLEEVK